MLLKQQTSNDTKKSMKKNKSRTMKFEPKKLQPSNSWCGKQRVSNGALNYDNVISRSKHINGEFHNNADNKRRKRIDSQ
jgi:hypothetical protein